jgi:hypothetical protein
MSPSAEVYATFDMFFEYRECVEGTTLKQEASRLSGNCNGNGACRRLSTRVSDGCQLEGPDPPLLGLPAATAKKRRLAVRVIIGAG